MTVKEYICPACGGTMDKMGPPNVGWLQCTKDHWIEKIEKYDSWVKWYRAYHDNPDCTHEGVTFAGIQPHSVYEEVGSHEIDFRCHCSKCFHSVHVKVTKDALSYFLTKYQSCE